MYEKPQTDSLKYLLKTDFFYYRFRTYSKTEFKMK